MKAEVLIPSDSDAARAAYDAFAPYYDDYTRPYQAASWTGSLAALAESCGVSGRTLLDVGCGTGKSFLPMIERGWRATACDLSPAMIERARAKVVGKDVKLAVADMRQLPDFGEFDLVWALNDAVVNLRDEEELEATLAGMKRNLAPRGAILFDVNTLSLCRAIATKDVMREVDGRWMRWTAMAESFAPGGVAESRFEVAGEPAAARVHRHRHFPEARVLDVIGRAGLEAVGVWGDYEGEQTQPLDEERHQKAIYVVR